MALFYKSFSIFLVTHGCIVATVKLYLPDGKEAKARFVSLARTGRDESSKYGFPTLCSPSTGIQDEEESCELGKQDLYQLNQWIQVISTKLE